MKKTLVGVIALAATGLAAAGCSSSSSTPTTTQAARTTTTTAASGTTTTAAGASASGGATPTEVAQAYVATITALQAGSAAGSFCTSYVRPSEAARCQSSLSDVAPSSVKIKDLALGKIDVEGSRAVLNFTATVCDGSTCDTISNPNSAMAKGTSFDKAFAAASDPNSSDPTVLAGAATQVDGRWFATGF